MGFFDSLLSTNQDPQILAKKKGLTQEGQDFFKGNPEDAPEGFIPPEAQDSSYPQGEPQKSQDGISPEDRRRLYAMQESQVVKKEQKVLSEIKNILSVSDSRMTPELKRVQDALGKGMMTPKQVASDLDVILKKKGWNTHDNIVIDRGHLQRLAVLRNELASAMDERAKFEAQVAPTGPAQAPDSATLEKDAVEASKKAEAAALEASQMGVLSGDSKRQEAENFRQQAAAMLKLSQEQAGKKPAPEQTYAEKNADPSLPPTNPKPLESEFSALGIKREKLVNDVIKILEGVGIEEGEWDVQVPTQAGLKRLLSVMDPEGTFASKLAADIVAEKQRNQPQQADEFATAQKESEGRANRLDAQLQQQRSELKELYKSLNSQPFMQTWIGMTLFVVLSLLGGPTNAAKLLGIGRNRNAIMGEIESIKEEMRYTNQQMNREEERSFQLRKEAIARMQRERDYKRSKDDSLNRMYINHKLILERAKRSAAPQNKAIVSKLEGDFNRTLKFMADAKQIMNNDWLDERDPKKIKASREYDRYRQEAEFIDQKLRALTEEIAPGTYSSEEEEAQAP